MSNALLTYTMTLCQCGIEIKKHIHSILHNYFKYEFI